jgi:2-polyprenyl-3-methyl-5-hydroxy-6-metoxy-1,4-benzoquinol methylase
MNQEFNAHRFWESRHVEFKGDHRNVGNRGLTSEQNLVLIASKAALVSHRLGVLGIKPPARVLDAGCGAGVFTSMLAPVGYDLFGSDVSPTAIETAKQTGCGEFAVSSLVDVGFPHKFDAVLCLDVLFHLVDDLEWAASVRALFGATLPGGVFVIIEHFPGEGAAQAAHCRWRTVDDYKAALPQADWVEISNFRYPHERKQKSLLIARRTA